MFQRLEGALSVIGLSGPEIKSEKYAALIRMKLPLELAIPPSREFLPETVFRKAVAL
jgi:hypothetical protein